MIPARPGSCLRLLAAALLFSPWTASGQSTGSQPPAEEPGWGSAWLQPANEQGRFAAAMKARNYPAALEICDRAIQKQPGQVNWYCLRAQACEHLKRFDHALADLDHAQALAQRQQPPAPQLGLFYIRARVHQEMGDPAAAVPDLQKALRADPRYVRALNGLAWLRATSPDATVRDGREAIDLARKAVALQRVETCVVIDTLAAAYAEAGDYPRAVDNEQRVLALIPKEIKDPDKLKKIQQRASERLRLFEQRQPYHAPFDVN